MFGERFPREPVYNLSLFFLVRHTTNSEEVMEYTTYYHWGNRPPRPVPFESKGQQVKGVVVFLTTTPARVAFCMARARCKNLYVLKVPKNVERACKPHWCDGAQQLIVPAHMWNQVVFLGKVSEAKKQTFIQDLRFSKSSLDTSNPEIKGSHKDLDFCVSKPSFQTSEVLFRITERSRQAKREELA